MGGSSLAGLLLAVAAARVVVPAAAAPAPASAARAFFVFGDSLVDNGNNNYLMTTARADAPPYGIDFPTHMPTGRFSNGLNIPDIISEYLGSQPALPYLSPDLRGDNLLVGANFASAGVGILNDTGIQFVNIIRIGQQLENFQNYQQKLAAFAGEDAARQVVEQSLRRRAPTRRREHLGAEPVLPYLSPHLDGEKMLVGANFASAGIGILNDTGVQFANIIHIEKQIRYFEQYQDRLRALVGEEEARKVVAGSLVLITLGGNDFVNNYYLVPFSVRSRQFAIQDYVPYLISEYRKILTRLHELGPRRVIVTGTGMIGCVPAELAMHSIDGECATDLTQAADLFNPQLERMLAELNSELGGHVFIAANTNKISFDFMFNPQDYGFVTAKVACCGQGPYNGIGLCTPASNVCANRDVYAYWDAFHPTERANRLIVAQLMHGSTDHIRPMNLSTILAMDAMDETRN
uniref:Uncharacterized protein n=1 Tax=Oryza brachyantha TaxID=4533 RepID=J3LZF3_ORYBR